MELIHPSGHGPPGLAVVGLVVVVVYQFVVEGLAEVGYPVVEGLAEVGYPVVEGLAEVGYPVDVGLALVYHVVVYQPVVVKGGLQEDDVHGHPVVLVLGHVVVYQPDVDGEG